MKVIILAGGYGTRLAEYTDTIPKPMVPIGDIPMIVHIINLYHYYNFNEFIIAAGYKGDILRNYFADHTFNFNIKIVDTGIDTMTGGRLKKLKDLLKQDTFMLTYGDGLSDVNIDKLVKFHKDNKKLVTVTAVRPLARFGALILEKNMVKSFKEKSQLDEGWINGGFFVMEPDFIDLIDNDQSILEKEPLEKATSIKQMMAYKHEGFWQCMDHYTDKKKLDDLYNSGVAPWLSTK